MEVAYHLKASLLVSPAVAFYTVGSSDLEVLLISALAGVAAGVLIDLDHFPVYRIESGSWKHLRKALRNPFSASTDNVETLMWFEPWKKYVAHGVSVPVIALLVFSVYRPAFITVCCLLALHLSMDVFHSYKNNELFF